MPPERLPGKGLLLVVGGRAVFADMSVEENLDIQALVARMNKLRLRSAAKLSMRRSRHWQPVADKRPGTFQEASSNSSR